MARRGIKAEVPDAHREQRLLVVTAGENPQLDCLQLVGVCSKSLTDSDTRLCTSRVGQRIS